MASKCRSAYNAAERKCCCVFWRLWLQLLSAASFLGLGSSVRGLRGVRPLVQLKRRACPQLVCATALGRSSTPPACCLHFHGWWVDVLGAWGCHCPYAVIKCLHGPLHRTSMQSGGCCRVADAAVWRMLEHAGWHWGRAQESVLHFVQTADCILLS